MATKPNAPATARYDRPADVSIGYEDWLTSMGLDPRIVAETRGGGSVTGQDGSTYQNWQEYYDNAVAKKDAEALSAWNQNESDWGAYDLASKKYADSAAQEAAFQSDVTGLMDSKTQAAAAKAKRFAGMANSGGRQLYPGMTSQYGGI